MQRFTLLSRPGCHLCEELEAAVLALFAAQIEIEVVQVDHYPVWRDQYGLRIPVLLDARERFVCALAVDANAIETALRQVA